MNQEWSKTDVKPNVRARHVSGTSISYTSGKLLIGCGRDSNGVKVELVMPSLT